MYTVAWRVLRKVLLHEHGTKSLCVRYRTAVLRKITFERQYTCKMDNKLILIFYYHTCDFWTLRAIDLTLLELAPKCCETDGRDVNVFEKRIPCAYT